MLKSSCQSKLFRPSLVHLGPSNLVHKLGPVGVLQCDLDRIGKRNIPVDVVLKQRREVLGV